MFGRPLQVATLVQADWLFLLTDVDCLYTANPNVDPHAQPIHEVFDMRDLQASRQARAGLAPPQEPQWWLAS